VLCLSSFLFRVIVSQVLVLVGPVLVLVLAGLVLVLVNLILVLVGPVLVNITAQYIVDSDKSVQYSRKMRFEKID